VNVFVWDVYECVCEFGYERVYIMHYVCVCVCSVYTRVLLCVYTAYYVCEVHYAVVMYVCEPHVCMYACENMHTCTHLQEIHSSPLPLASYKCIHMHTKHSYFHKAFHRFRDNLSSLAPCLAHVRLCVCVCMCAHIVAA